MKFVNTTTNETFAIGTCKNNTPPKHFLVTGEKRAVKVDGVTATMYIARERSIYVVIHLGTQFLYAASHAIFDAKSLKTFVKPVTPATVTKREDGAMTS